MEPPGSSSVEPNTIQKATNSASESWFNGFRCFVETFYPFDQPGVAFLLAPTSREIGYSPMNLVLFLNLVSCDQRNVLGDCVVAPQTALTFIHLEAVCSLSLG